MGTVIISTSVCWVREHLPMAICVFNMQLTVTQRSMFVFHSKAVLVKSGSSTGVFQSLWNSLCVQGDPSHVSVLSLGLSTQAIQISRSGGQELPRFPSVLCVLVFSVALLRLLSLWLVWVLLSVFKGGLWWCLSRASVFRVARFAPSVSHHCFWLSPLTGNERFILSGLNYIVPSWLLVLLHSK